MRDATEEIGRGVESKGTDGKGKRTSGISKMDAIARTLVLELESSKLQEDASAATAAELVCSWEREMKQGNATEKVPMKGKMAILITFA